MSAAQAVNGAIGQQTGIPQPDRRGWGMVAERKRKVAPKIKFGTALFILSRRSGWTNASAANEWYIVANKHAVASQ